MFELHPQLAQDTTDLIETDQHRILLVNDSRYPWIILVPKINEVTEIHHLTSQDQTDLMSQITRISEVMENLFQPHKINIGALGNLVPQLHIHIIARFKTDASWPGPVWGVGKATPYDTDQLSLRVKKIQKMLE